MSENIVNEQTARAVGRAFDRTDGVWPGGAGRTSMAVRRNSQDPLEQELYYELQGTPNAAVGAQIIGRNPQYEYYQPQDISVYRDPPGMAQVYMYQGPPR
jgi:hypothetical protein